MVRPEIKKKLREKAAMVIQSRKTQKKLEKIVLHKKSKENRKSILANLKKFQLQPEQLELLHSTSSMQTRGLKRFTTDDLLKIDRAEIKKCPDAATLIRRKRRKVKPKAVTKMSSSSEDTDEMSSDNDETSKPIDPIIAPIHPTDETKQIDHVTSEAPVMPTDSDKTATESDHKIVDSMTPREPAVFVQVSRHSEVEESRSKLPIIGEEQYIMEKIRYHDVVIISGETGSGKTTQLPQFLYEAGYTRNDRMIGITEPRRVAAVSMSERVAHELNLTTEEVSYQIRFSGNVTSKTSIKFMTDGVLLRELQKDFLLTKYSVIIIDEAHERSVFSDILIGLLSRIVPLRAKRQDPLKLVIMSATLRVGDFTENRFLFKLPPPTIKIETRQYPVTVQFASKTPENYLLAAYKKVCAIHTKLPKGGILVFVTSQMDVKVLCRKLREKFGNHSSKTTGSFSKNPDLNDWSDNDSEMSDEGTICCKTPLRCLELYAMLPLAKQKLVFQNPPDGSRLCVVATNVAETSITIPNVKYVVDTGLEKSRVYDLVTSASRFVTTWTSKSSAEQRKGRAGRMGPGQCYRLYSSAVYNNDMPDFAEPRILQKPLEDVLLQMKCLNIDNVINFPFPTRPSLEALQAAEKKLILLGALDNSKSKHNTEKKDYSSRPTKLGRAMARFAVSARCSKMLVLSPADLLPYVICLVSALTVREMFLEGDKWRDLRKKWVGHGSSKLLGDFMLMIRAVTLADKSGCSTKSCTENGLRPKALLEIDRLRKQLTQEVNKNLNHPTIDMIQTLKKPDKSQSSILRQILLSSYSDHVARKIPDSFIVKKDPKDPNKVERRRLKHAYECAESDEPVFISSESVLKGGHPEYVIYKELYKGDKKTYMRDVAVISSEWLPQ